MYHTVIKKWVYYITSNILFTILYILVSQYFFVMFTILSSQSIPAIMRIMTDIKTNILFIKKLKRIFRISNIYVWVVHQLTQHNISSLNMNYHTKVLHLLRGKWQPEFYYHYIVVNYLHYY